MQIEITLKVLEPEEKIILTPDKLGSDDEEWLTFTKAEKEYLINDYIKSLREQPKWVLGGFIED